jgi:hypothetical protein
MNSELRFTDGDAEIDQIAAVGDPVAQIDHGQRDVEPQLLAQPVDVAFARRGPAGETAQAERGRQPRRALGGTDDREPEHPRRHDGGHGVDQRQQASFPRRARIAREFGRSAEPSRTPSAFARAARDPDSGRPGPPSVAARSRRPRRSDLRG